MRTGNLLPVHFQVQSSIQQSGSTARATINLISTRMWANAQRHGRPAEHRWRPLFNAAKFG